MYVGCSSTNTLRLPVCCWIHTTMELWMVVFSKRCLVVAASTSCCEHSCVCTFRRTYLTCRGRRRSAVCVQDLISISAWDDVVIFYTNRETMRFVCQRHHSTQSAVCFWNVFIVLKCVIFGVLLPDPFLKVYLQEPTLTSGYQCICILFWRCLQPCCTMTCFKV